jgi:hypothetical protein
MLATSSNVWGDSRKLNILEQQSLINALIITSLRVTPYARSTIDP